MSYNLDLYHTCTIELTNQCNFNCIHCFAKGSIRRSVITYDQLIKIERKLRKLDIVRFHLFGGEPFHNPDFPAIYLYLYDCGYQISITTNISLLTDEMIMLFYEKKPDLMDISIYGSCRTEYIATTKNDCYDDIIRNIQKLEKAFPIHAKVICTNTNSNNGKDYSLIKEHVTWISYYTNIVANVHNACNPKDYEISISDKYKLYKAPAIPNESVSDKYICPVYETSLYIDSIGSIGFCPFSVFHDSSIFGLKDLEKEIIRLQNEFKGNYLYPQFCIQCQYKRTCQCPMVLKIYTQDQIEKECEWSRLKAIKAAALQ